ncbi:MAG TPA: AMP-binding protein [Polyangiaceae bacterium]|nr:AMP-binding protein [Polyangiaceae bacterium]
MSAVARAPGPPPIDLGAAADRLREGRAGDAWLGSWLPASGADPEAFGEATLALLGERRGAVFKSRPADGCDLYHDLVAAHLGRRRRALAGREGGAWVGVSYEALHARSNALGAAWAEAGVKAGESVALVIAPGLEFAVAWLTALRMGLVPSFVPPFGPGFVQKTLARVGADRVATSGRRGVPAAVAAGALPAAAGSRSGEPFGSFFYPAGAPAARLVTPFGPDAPVAVDLPAEVLLGGAARDAAFVYGLAPHDVLAAPGLDPLQHGPALLSAALAAGASYAELSDGDLEAEPELIRRLGVSVLGLGRRARDALAGRGGPPEGVRAWFRSVSETIDAEAWDTFYRALPEARRLNFGVLANAASGGACLFSPPSRDAPGLRIWPAPGLAYRLEAPAAEGLEALDDAGVFCVLRGGEIDGSFARAVIGRVGEGYTYAGSLDLGPDAQRHPAADVEDAARRVPGVRYAASFEAPGRRLNEAKTVLLAFVEDGGPAPPPDPGHVAAAVVAELGERFAPDRVEIFALRPRLQKGELDRAWCRAQYLSGSLSRKARSRPFVLLGRLGYLFDPG